MLLSIFKKKNIFFSHHLRKNQTYYVFSLTLDLLYLENIEFGREQKKM